MIWMLLAHVAWAGATPEELSARVSALYAELARPICLAVAGPEVERAVERAIPPELKGSVQVVRIPSVGNLPAEGARALRETGLPCGLRISDSAEGGWLIAQIGLCTPVGQAADAAAPESAPVVGPLPSLAVLTPPEPPAQDPPSTGAEATTTPSRTVVLAPPPVAPTGPQDAALPAGPAEEPRELRIARYNAERLQIRELDPTEAPEGVRWEVSDGRSQPLDARALATLGDEREVLARLDRESRHARRNRRILFWSGIGLMALSPIPLTGLESGLPSRSEDRIFTSLFLAGTGGLMVGTAPLVQRGVLDRQRWAASYLTPTLADEIVTAHNFALYKRLGLEEPQPGPTTGPGPEPAPPKAALIGVGRPETPPDATDPTGPVAPEEISPAPSAEDPLPSPPPGQQAPGSSPSDG